MTLHLDQHADRQEGTQDELVHYLSPPTRRYPTGTPDTWASRRGVVMNSLRHTAVLRTAVVILAGGMILSAGVEVAAAAALAPTATTAQVSAVHPTSVTVNGSVNPNGTATSWYVQYGVSTNAAYGSQTASKSAGAGNVNVKVSDLLVGLSPATSYHYRFVASSSAGTAYGGDGTFNTSAAPAVVTGAASHVTSTTASLNAMVNPEGLATSWYFQFGPTAGYGTKTATKSLAPGPIDVAVTSAVANLTAQATYHYRVVASSSAGKTYGTDVVVVTGAPLTLNASLPTIGYGHFVTLSGMLESGLPGKEVTIESKRFNEATFAGVATTTTGPGGTWDYVAQPSARTTYKAVASNGSSSPVVVSVRPSVSLNVSSSNHLSTSVFGAVPFGSHVLQLQRLSFGTWVTWKSVRLNSSARATFITLLPKGRTTIRMAIGPFVFGIDQAAPGYLAGISRTLIYRR